MFDETKAKTQVLFVDDALSICTMVKTKLEDDLVDVCTTSNSDAALEKLREQKFDVAFVDINLGDEEFDGIEFVERIRKHNSALPICMLSGDDSADLVYSCLLAGANDYIWKGSVKPSPLKQMKNVIDSLEQNAPRFQDAILESSVLIARGMCESQLELLSVYTKCDFPDIYELSDITNVSENALVKRFSRIEKQLGLKNRAALVKLLTICSGFGQRFMAIS